MNIEAKIEQSNEENITVASYIPNMGLDVLSEFADRFTHVENALDDLVGASGESTAKSLARVQTKLEEFEPTVTLLGQVKSGKTSLVNAMAGWPDLLPSDVNPWTSVVTSLHLQPGSERPSTAARFQFMTEDEWDRLSAKGGRIGELAGRAGAESELEKIRAQIEEMRRKSQERLGRNFELLMGQQHEYGYFDKNLLERYICLGDAFETIGELPDFDDQGQFADITRTADLYLNSRTLPFRMCLRDTPGVNDTFMMREQITIQAIRGSRVCVVVLSASQALTSVDMGLIRLISNLDTRELIIFVNRIDELSDPARQVPEIEASIRATLENQNGPKDVEIMFGSAYWANKVLAGELDALGTSSSDALLSWAESALLSDKSEQSAADMIWELSGLPALLQSMSRRLVEKEGDDFIRNTATSAVNLATAQQAANSLTITESERPDVISAEDVKAEFEHIASTSLRALNVELENVFEDYRVRADRAHATYVAKATQSLEKYLEKWGPDTSWEHNADSLRVLLRTAYKVMGRQVQSTAQTQYETAVADVAKLLYRAFGSAVEGIEIGVPDVPDVPPPISLGQTIAMDFREGWWMSWWGKLSGYKAQTKRLQNLISTETQEVMEELKFVQPDALQATCEQTLSDFFDEQRDILLELTNHPANGSALQDIFRSEDEIAKRNTIEKALSVLRPLAA